jgi:hypothetical protein
MRKETTVDTQQDLDESALVILTILANVSFVPKNQPIMGAHAKVIETIFWTLSLPVRDMDVENQLYFCKEITALDYRKLSITILANIAEFCVLPSAEFASLILTVCTDFIHNGGSYSYLGLSVLSNLLLNSSNRAALTGLKMNDTINVVMKQLPLLLTAEVTPQEMAVYELCMVIIVCVCKDFPPKNHVKHLLSLCRKPRSINVQVASAFDSIRERAITTLFECNLGLEYESTLTGLILFSLQMGDQWMCLKASALLLTLIPTDL